MNRLKIAIFLMAGLLLTYCGDPGVDISEESFNRKIVVEAFLFPEEPVEGIKLMRNYELNTGIDLNDLYLTPELNEVQASINGVELFYNSETGKYYNTDIVPAYNTPYTLEVSAVIDGKHLQTSSTTITPKQGFTVVNENLGTLKYRENKAILEFMPSPGTDFYAFSIVPLDANLDNFIYDNPFFTDISREDLEENFEDFYYQSQLMINVNSYLAESITYEISELDTWFYTDYEVILYAGDKNFKDYALTVENVQEGDGNFIEPAFHFSGDGIGIFGSAIKGQVLFSLVK